AAILAVLLGWVYTITKLFGDLADASSLDPVLLGLQLLGILVFVGGVAVMAWYVYTAFNQRWRWTAKTWSVLLLIAAATVLYVALVFKLAGFATTY
ncbi:MAG: serine hydrolase, partial [Sphingomicrobium sp.]